MEKFFIVLCLISFFATSTFRHLDLLHYADDLINGKDIEINHKYMVTIFIPKVIKLFDEGIKSESDTDKGGNFIVGIKNRLFET